MNRCRAWIAWLFLLATLVAQGPHRHVRPAPEFAEELGSCDEAGRHWAGHEAAVHAHEGDACPLCQLRGQPMLAEPAPRPVEPTGTPARFVAAIPRREAGPTLRTRCRAPPHA